jgi:hypothetical protein
MNGSFPGRVRGDQFNRLPLVPVIPAEHPACFATTTPTNTSSTRPVNAIPAISKSSGPRLDW